MLSKMNVGECNFYCRVAQVLQIFNTKFHTAVPRGSVQWWPLTETGVANNGDFWSFYHRVLETVENMAKITFNY